MFGKLTDTLGITRSTAEGEQSGAEEDRKAPPTSSAASILRQQRTASVPPATVGRSITSVMPSSTEPAKTEINQEVLEHLRAVADRSPVPGYRELMAQVDVLRKHIKDEGALYAAALDTIAASGIKKDAVLKAVQDRINLIKAEVAGTLTALEEAKIKDVAEREARVIQINNNVEQLEREIEERQSLARQLNTERDQLKDQLSAADSECEAQRQELNLAAGVVLAELESQSTKLRSV